MLEEPSQAALGPAEALTPQRADCLDGLLADGHLGRQRHAAAGRGEASRQLEVLGQGALAPAADRLERVAAHEHPVPAQLGRAVGRPSAALAREVHQLLLLLGARQPRDRCVARHARDLERGRARGRAPMRA